MFRISYKILADFTGMLHLRHPYEVGRAYVASHENENEERSDDLLHARRFAPRLFAQRAVIAIIANSLQQQQVLALQYGLHASQHFRRPELESHAFDNKRR